MDRRDSDHWQLQTAKNRFSEVVRRAQATPQYVTQRGVEAVVVLGIEEYRRLTAQNSQPSLGEYLLSGPKLDEGEELDVTRSQEGPRTLDLGE